MYFYIPFTYYNIFRPSKSDSAPIRGDLAYKPTSYRISRANVETSHSVRVGASSY